MEHFRALFDHGYQQGLAAGRAEQQAAPEDSSGAQSDPEPSPSPAADAGLVGQVAKAIGGGGWEIWGEESRDAILAVVDWIKWNQMETFTIVLPDVHDVIATLEREANR